jgi:chromosome segregation ATPase
MKFVSLVLFTAALNSFPLLTAAIAADAATVAEKGGASNLADLMANAERGDALAQYNLGMAHAKGLQTPVNPVEALVWLTLAAERGTTGKELGTLLVSLNAEQIAAAGRRLESIRTTYPNLRSTMVAAGSQPPVASNTPSPIIAVPSGTSAPGTAIVAVRPPADPTQQLQDRVTAAIAVLQRERLAHAATRAELAALEQRMNELTAGRATLERGADGRGPQSAAAAKAADTDARSREIVVLEKSLAGTRDELSAAKTALAIANSRIQAAETRARAVAQTDSELTSLRSQVRILERDLQSATAALRRVATDKPATAPSLVAGTRPLVDANPESRGQQRVEPNRELTASAERKITELQSELNDVKSRQISAAKEIATRDAELAKLRAAVAAAESRLSGGSTEIETARRAADEAQQRLARMTEELAEARRQGVTARELESRVRQLEAERATLANRPADTGVSREEFESAAAARADVENKLKVALQSYTLVVRERDELRSQASAARELESRVRQLEAENARLQKGDGDAIDSKAEFARVVAARADAENKLSTVLRSFTLLTKERDELRARVADLSRKESASNQDEEARKK